MTTRLASVVLVAVVMAGCGDGATVDTTVPGTQTAPTTSPVTTSPATTTPVTTGPAANDLAAFARTTVLVGDETLAVAVADTPALRSQGLMGVTELVGVDGMLFVFEAEIEAAFWMKDTLIPLDIWFFDADGGFVDGFTMEPCVADPCPTYPAAAAFRYALETAVGRLASGESPALSGLPGG